MNLTQIYSMPMEEVLKQCNIVEQKMHTDEQGNIQAIEVKYVPQDKDFRKSMHKSTKVQA